MPLAKNLTPPKRRGRFCPDHTEDPKADLRAAFAQRLGVKRPSKRKTLWQPVDVDTTLSQRWADIAEWQITRQSTQTYYTTNEQWWQPTGTIATSYTINNLYTADSNAYTTTGTLMTDDRVWRKWLRPQRVRWYAGTNADWTWMDEPTGIQQVGRELLTPEEAAAATERLRAQAEQLRQREEAARAERAAARARAETLLRGCLTPEQLETLDRHGWFIVVGSHGSRYRINARGVSGNVDLLRADGRRQAALCAHTTGCPEPDAWLTQMLELTHDELGWLVVANVHSGSLPEDLRLAVHDRRLAHQPRVGGLVAA